MTFYNPQPPSPLPHTTHPQLLLPKKCEVWSVRVLIVAQKNAQCGEIYSLSSWFWQHSINGPSYITLHNKICKVSSLHRVHNWYFFVTKRSPSKLKGSFFSLAVVVPFFFFVSLFCSVLLSFPNSKIYWIYCYVNIVTYVDHFGCSGNSAQRTSSDWLVPRTW